MQQSDHDLASLRRMEPTPRWLADVASHGVEVIPAGPFRAILDPHAGWSSYAAPVEPLPPAPEVEEALPELRRLFAQRGQTLRIEFNEPLFPGLPALLERQGFVVEEREPLLLLSPANFRPEIQPEVSVRFLGAGDGEADLAAYQSIFSQVLLEQPGQGTPEGIEQLRREIAQCGNICHALATLDGTPVGTGFISSLEGVCEITRVATLPEARRRGVAATVTSFMLRDRFGRGDSLAWLTASGEPAQALYQKLGFRLVGERFYYRDCTVTIESSAPGAVGRVGPSADPYRSNVDDELCNG